MVIINKNIGDDVMAKSDMRDLLESILDEVAPEGKSSKDFGGGHIEVLKTKANIVLYFGFNGAKNRISIKREIDMEDVIIWTEALSEFIWNDKDSQKKAKLQLSRNRPKENMDRDYGNEDRD